MRNYVKSLISSNKFCSSGSRNCFYSRANKICSLKPPPIRFREIKNCKQIANGIHICLDLSSRARSGDWKNCSLRYLTSFVHITIDRLFASSAPSSGGRPLRFTWTALPPDLSIPCKRASGLGINHIKNNSVLDILQMSSISILSIFDVVFFCFIILSLDI